MSLGMHSFDKIYGNILILKYHNIVMLNHFHTVFTLPYDGILVQLTASSKMPKLSLASRPQVLSALQLELNPGPKGLGMHLISWEQVAII